MQTGIVHFLLWFVMTLICRSLRVRKINAGAIDTHLKEGRQCVIAFWHGSMLLGWYFHRPKSTTPVSALVSSSKDGQLLSALLERWGYTMIRGSSRKGGKEAMDLMTESVKNGSALCITPDGPTGPRHTMKMGAVRLAQKTNVPLFLVGCAAVSRKEFGSWDRFQLPRPWSRCILIYSDPIIVPTDLAGENLDHYRTSVEEQLNVLDRKAEEIVGGVASQTGVVT